MLNYTKEEIINRTKDLSMRYCLLRYKQEQELRHYKESFDYEIKDYIQEIHNIKILSKEIGKKPFVGYMGNRNIDVKENVLDISRFKNEFSFSPENSVEDGIKKYLEYIKNEVW